MAILAVSASRISPINMTSGSSRSIILTWNAPLGGALFYKVTITGAIGSSDFARGINPVPPYSTNINADQTYPWSIEACNNIGCSTPPTNGTPFNCPSEIPPWIFVDGDVHSNTGIHMH